jgi:toxin-antitoxin system PIN domain toxin
MSFATDTNILLYAINQDSEFHCKAKQFVEEKISGVETWIMPWPVIHAFLRISTHGAIVPRPLSPAQAISIIDQILYLPHVHLIGETDEFWSYYKKEILGGHLRGGAITDALIAALLKENGVSTIFTADRDFLKFKGIRVINPLV